jgi:hypothetical protein
VLVAAGAGLQSAELYDPATGTWSATGSLLVGRWVLASASLADGRVIALGGLNSTLTTSLSGAEIYDPAAGTWSPAGNMHIQRASHTATTALDGSVVIAGGFHREPRGDKQIERVEVFR